ncbi:uncharacterized protein BT62DRAFT_1079571 [Guyanagaster necrorhizus]|uniref:Uncharacterized protein n=1 Tax=Guyanagaster necrorhizus TaxID=856835 RepID=A0A9P7VKI5_9AGAR|nr:uncharacterized protein BT62DRAFT_1079571 [Guyanagaster necrorhizus MCA 3950]KAG7442035.1 hypothetical protein BT62DRAFT_1079571 [Guyanagaster necrorhizus MCA 3950]
MAFTCTKFPKANDRLIRDWFLLDWYNSSQACHHPLHPGPPTVVASPIGDKPSTHADFLAAIWYSLRSAFLHNPSLASVPIRSPFALRSHRHKIPALIWCSDYSYEISVELTRWLSVFCAFLFCALFGFASEAKKPYSHGYSKLILRPVDATEINFIATLNHAHLHRRCDLSPYCATNRAQTLDPTRDSKSILLPMNSLDITLSLEGPESFFLEFPPVDTEREPTYSAHSEG